MFSGNIDPLLYELFEYVSFPSSLSCVSGWAGFSSGSCPSETLKKREMKKEMIFCIMFLTSINDDDKSFVLFSYLSQDFCISKKSCIFAIVKNKTYNKVNNKIEEVDITPENIAQEDITPKPLDEPNYKDLYIRSLADYENMKKFMENKVANSKKTATANIISDIISPVYNDLRRGIQNNIDGCDLILKNVKSALDKMNINVMDDSIVDEQFDTDYMDAISSVNCIEQLDGTLESVVEPAFVVKENNKNYVYAKVIVRKYLGC